MNSEMTIYQPPVNKEIFLYCQALILGTLHRLWATLNRRSTHMPELDETLCCNQIDGSHYAGVHPVEIDHIHGSEGKGDAFDSNFYPTKEITRNRWLGIAKELLRGRDLPPVELVEVEGEYFAAMDITASQLRIAWVSCTLRLKSSICIWHIGLDNLCDNSD